METFETGTADDYNYKWLYGKEIVMGNEMGMPSTWHHLRLETFCQMLKFAKLACFPPNSSGAQQFSMNNI